MRTEHLEVRAVASLLSHPRIAVVVGKYGHMIVERNRLRRRLREIARLRLMPQLGGIDLVIRSRAKAYGATFEQLKAEVDQLGEALSSARL